MTPVPNKPVVVILMDEDTNDVLNISNNIDPDLKVVITRDQETYNAASLGDPYQI